MCDFNIIIFAYRGERSVNVHNDVMHEADSNAMKNG